MFVVEEITVDGKAFRPSDWIERLVDTVSSYGTDRRTRHGPYSGPDRRRRQAGFLRAQMIGGRKCLVVDARLQAANPAALRFLQDFVQSNRLRTQAVDPDPALGALPSSGGIWPPVQGYASVLRITPETRSTCVSGMPG